MRFNIQSCFISNRVTFIEPSVLHHSPLSSPPLSLCQLRICIRTMLASCAIIPKITNPENQPLRFRYNVQLRAIITRRLPSTVFISVSGYAVYA